MRAGGRLDGKTALVTGGAAGVGLESAALFAREGARVAVVDVRPESDEQRSALADVQDRVAILQGDVSDPADVRRVVEEATARLGPPDVLFNHAGVVSVAPFLDTPLEEWQRLWSVNVASMVLMCQAVLPQMLEAGRGTIVNTSSISGLTASPLESAYCVTKGAVLQLTRALAVEYRDRGIRCNAICPGFIRTRHGLNELAALNAAGEAVGEQEIASLQGRFCEPIEVARAALHLASDESSFTNGAALVVDNGWMALS